MMVSLLSGIARLNGLGLCVPATRNTEAVKNYPRGVGTIEGVEVNAGYVVIQKIVTLFQGEVNSDAPDSFRIIFASLKRAQKPGRKACATGQLRNAFESADRRNRHDPRDNWDVNASERTTFAKIEEIAIIEK